MTEPAHDTAAGTPAVRELARDHTSRRRFLTMAGGGGAAGALAVVLAACGDDDETGGGGTTTGGTDTAGMDAGGDLAIANYALTLEYIEADFYEAVVGSGLFRGAQLETIKTFGEHEAEHVTALTQLIETSGGTPAERPMTTFPLESAEEVLMLAATVENLGAAAYLGQADKIQSPEVLAAALSIHSVEARHASALNALTGKSVVPNGAFAVPASMDEVLKQVQPFLA